MYLNLKIYENVKDELFNMTRAWDKEISESPTGIEPMTSRTHGRRSIHWANENSWRARSFNWVHVWQASCILLGSALSNSLWVVISKFWWWMLSSVKKCERWIIQHDTSVGQRNRVRFPSGTLIFLCPTLVSCWIIHLSHFFTELNIHHQNLLIIENLFKLKHFSGVVGFDLNTTLRW